MVQPPMTTTADLERGGDSYSGREWKEEEGYASAVAAVCASSRDDGDLFSGEGTSSSSSSSSAGGARPHGVVLEWHVAELSVGNKGKKIRILESIAGRVESGQLLVILGPSGAGKSSLIECLSLRNREFTGAVHLDGKSADSDFFTRTALVYQGDMLFGFLTVREHLTFHATTRMSDRSSSAKINERVEVVMQELGLAKCADTVIGGTEPIFLMKGISGGERKRLSIATELLLCPQVIMLDEATSGLDSVMSESVVQSLRAVADHGAAVVACLHSPSCSMTDYFTHALVLTADGRLAYHGPYQGVEMYLTKSLGLRLPAGYSTVEFVLCLVSRSAQAEESPEALADRMGGLVDAFVSSGLALSHLLAPEDSHRQFLKSVTGLHASWLTLTLLNARRQLVLVRRDIVSFALSTLSKLLLGLVFGTLYFGSAGQEWRHLMGVLYLGAVAILFVGIMGPAVVFPLEWPKVTREYMSGANAIGPYVASKTLHAIPFLLGGAGMATIMFWMTGMGPDMTRYLLLVAVMVMTEYAGASLGFLLGSLSSNPLVGIALIPVVVFPMIIFSGIFYGRAEVPVYLQWMQLTSIVNHSFYALLGSQAHVLPQKGRDFLLGFCQVDPAASAIHLAGLAIITVVCYILLYVSLRVRLAASSQIM